MKLVTKDGKLLTWTGALKTSEADSPDCEECCGGKPCGQVATSGGDGVTVDDYPMPDREGEIEFQYDSISVPDSFKVEGGGTVFVDTGPVSTYGWKSVKFCKPKGLRSLKVTVTGGNLTGWSYVLGCPGPPCDPNGYPGPSPPDYTPRGDETDPSPEEARAMLQLWQAARDGKEGVGTELSAILGKFWIKATDDCKCKDRQILMNKAGPQWCRENIELIGTWLAEGARERGIPYVPFLGRQVIEQAIANWEAKSRAVQFPVSGT